MVTISVIIPTYNRSDVISRAIESVLTQTFPDFELLIIDDCSTDNTKQIVNRFDDPRVCYFRHDMNQGGSAARNTGIDHAEGDYIAFLDSDDEWFPRKLERQVNYLESLPEEWVAVYCKWEGKRNGYFGKIRGLMSRYFSDKVGAKGGEELIPHILTMTFPIGGASTLLVKRETVEAMGGFDESFQRHQDWEFLIRLLQHGKLGCVSKELFRKYSTGAPDPTSLEETKQQFFEKFSYLIQRYEDEGYRIMARHQLVLARKYYQSGNFHQGNKYAMNAFVPDPKLYLALAWGMSSGVVSSSKSLLRKLTNLGREPE